MDRHIHLRSPDIPLLRLAQTFSDNQEHSSPWKCAKINVVRENRHAATSDTLSHAQIDSHDPRWILAMQTKARLQGTLLTPEQRAALTQSGRRLGLQRFETNLVIAIVQDQARREHPLPSLRIAQPPMPSVDIAPHGVEPHGHTVPDPPWIAAFVTGALCAIVLALWLLAANIDF